MSATAQQFGKFRSLFWPIQRKEIKIFLPLFLIYALICLNYTILRVIKDPIVMTAPGAGAEVLPFLKVGAILPMALLSTYVFSRLVNKYSQEKVFYFLMSGFLVFFVLFITVLYPLQDYLHPTEFCDWLEGELPKGFTGFVASIRNWTCTLFYVMAELWSTTIMTVLFWGFANHITPVGDAKRYYGILGVGANIATILAGTFPALVSTYYLDFSFYFGDDMWAQYIANITLVIVASGLACMGIFRWYHKNILTNGLLPNSPHHAESSDSSKKIKMSLKKSFLYLAKSKYLISIAVIVLTYNIAMNLLENVWKDQVKSVFDNSTDMAIYFGRVTTIGATIATIVGFFFTSALIRKSGWTFSALVTPAIMLITGGLFFSFALIKDSRLGEISAFYGFSPLSLVVFFGATQQALIRASKYTFFDATKEISYIPLSRECKLKGKAAIDGVGSRLGKSGGSILCILLITSFESLSACVPIVAIILLGVLAAFIIAVRTLGHQFNDLTSHNEKIDIEEGAQTVEGDSKKKEVLV